MTDEELFELVRNAYQEANKGYILEQVNEACKYCLNRNSGQCNCILGSMVMY